MRIEHQDLFANGDYLKHISGVKVLLQQLDNGKATLQVVMFNRIVYSLMNKPAKHHLQQVFIRTREHSQCYLV